MSDESRSAAKLRTEPLLDDLVRDVQQISLLSQASLDHLQKRLHGVATQALIKQNRGDALLLRGVSELVGRFREACRWDAPAPQPTAKPAPATRRVRWPEGEE
jgi:hypothetical protein